MSAPNSEPVELVGLPKRLLTTTEVADYLGVTPRWLEDAVRARQVRCTRLGKHVRFTHAHVADFISAREQPVMPVIRPSRGGGRSRL
jgi:excisionase family DNA binding protein